MTEYEMPEFMPENITYSDEDDSDDSDSDSESSSDSDEEGPFLIEHHSKGFETRDPNEELECVPFKIEDIFDELVEEIARLFPKGKQFLEIRIVNVNQTRNGRLRDTYWIKRQGDRDDSLDLQQVAKTILKTLDIGRHHDTEDNQFAWILERISLRLLEVQDKTFFYMRP